MKTDSGHSHGHVFDDDGINVTIWAGVIEIMQQYKDDFLNSCSHK